MCGLRLRLTGLIGNSLNKQCFQTGPQLSLSILRRTPRSYVPVVIQNWIFSLDKQRSNFSLPIFITHNTLQMLTQSSTAFRPKLHNNHTKHAGEEFSCKQKLERHRKSTARGQSKLPPKHEASVHATYIRLGDRNLPHAPRFRPHFPRPPSIVPRCGW